MKSFHTVIFVLAVSSYAQGAAPAPVAVTIATERGVQSTAPREWLQLLTAIGVRDIQIRSIRAGESPNVEDVGSTDRPRYRVVGVLDSSGTLTVPGGRFDSRSRSALADYFDRLANDGREGITAKKGRYGLTEKQFQAVYEQLSIPTEIATQGRRLGELLDKTKNRLEFELRIDSKARDAIEQSEPVADEVRELTLGTALSLLLRRDGLVLVPEKQRGEEVSLRIARLVDVASNDDDEQALADLAWPVGWKSEAQRRQLAPAMMEYLNAQIEGFTLAEAMATIAPRTGVPILWDHATLRKHKIDPTTVEVKYPKKRSQLIRVIDRLLFQARLRGELKVDEAGTVFYWISR